jgi:hypothetical protein
VKSSPPVVIAAMVFLAVLVIPVGPTAQGWCVNNKEHGRYTVARLSFFSSTQRQAQANQGHIPQQPPQKTPR